MKKIAKLNEEITQWSKTSNYTPGATEMPEKAVDDLLVQAVINRMTDLSVDREEYIRRLRELNDEFPTKVKVFGEKVQKFENWNG